MEISCRSASFRFCFTVVRYDWCVHTTCAWMNALVPLLRPVFQWNHDAMMREGGAALARLLGIEHG